MRVSTIIWLILIPIIFSISFLIDIKLFLVVILFYNVIQSFVLLESIDILDIFNIHTFFDIDKLKKSFISKPYFYCSGVFLISLILFILVFILEKIGYMLFLIIEKIEYLIIYNKNNNKIYTSFRKYIKCMKNEKI